MKCKTEASTKEHHGSKKEHKACHLDGSPVQMLKGALDAH